MKALEDFDTTVTLCFTPPSRGKAPHCTSPPLVLEEFAEFASAVINRYVVNWPPKGLAETNSEPELSVG